MSDAAATVNIVEPTPPAARKASSWKKLPAPAQAALDRATTTRPPQKTRSSPRRPIRRPLTGANAIRTNANTLTTVDAAVRPTSKLRAKVGSAGATMP